MGLHNVFGSIKLLYFTYTRHFVDLEMTFLLDLNECKLGLVLLLLLDEQRINFFDRLPIDGCLITLFFRFLIAFLSFTEKSSVIDLIQSYFLSGLFVLFKNLIDFYFASFALLYLFKNFFSILLQSSPLEISCL
jgi:hypothetical protein